MRNEYHERRTMNRLKGFALCLICMCATLCIEAFEPPFIDRDDQSDLVPKWHRLIGRRGEKGGRGKRGKKGKRGKEGTRGLKGVRGATGSLGHTGKQGKKGKKGPRGVIGTTGTTGGTGATGVTGPTGPNGIFVDPAFGSATLTGPTGGTAQIPITPVPFTVPLKTGQEIFQGVTFNDLTSTFTITQGGVFAIDYFVQILFESAANVQGPPATIQLVISGVLPPSPVQDELFPTPLYGNLPWGGSTPASYTNYVALTSGTKHIVRNLFAGDTLQLQINSLPVATGGMIRAFFDDYAKTANPPIVVAYASVHKIG